MHPGLNQENKHNMAYIKINKYNLASKCYNWLKSRQKCNNPDINKET
jgi:hypothetical protein